MSIQDETTGKDHDHGHDKTYSIIVNGRPRTVVGKELSYENLLKLAFGDKVPTGPNVVISAVYSRGENGKQGSLLPGDSVKVKDGMVFDVTATDKS